MYNMGNCSLYAQMFSTRLFKVLNYLIFISAQTEILK